jgi:hypothetical protein
MKVSEGLVDPTELDSDVSLELRIPYRLPQSPMVLMCRS